MIHYQLRCADGHGFEGWFRDSGAFEQQSAGGLLCCPSCGSTDVDRGLMAPMLRPKRARAPMLPDPAQPTPDATPVAMPDAMVAQLQRLRARIERDCENMGERFADEAIRISQGEATDRGIYGTTTDSDREALADAGVAVMAIPWAKPADG